MRYRSLLGGAAHFIGSMVTHPFKTVFNTVAGIKDGADGADKLIAPVAGAGGLVMLGIGLWHRDLALSGIGLTFTSVAGGIYQHHGEEVMQAARNDVAEKEKDTKIVEPEDARVEEKEATPSEAAEILAEDTKGTGLGRKPSFKPNLPRPDATFMP